MRLSIICAGAVYLATTTLLTACSEDVPPSSSDTRRAANEIYADDIPVAHTPTGGPGNSFPSPACHVHRTTCEGRT